ncbi:MAG: adenosylcobinamide-GDP ribazoletransferase, partial [Mangrovicoccus sp.]|nr:adenosylcobinamide-GDP ribazoletransferase [Mangrovicoccus sp.]
MNAHPQPLIAPIDPASALGLMTRLPVPVNGEAAAKRGGHAAWAWPLAGAVIGGLAGAVFWLSMALGLSALSAALLAVFTQVFITGALHEDGLADCADGFWGAWDPARRREIMRDSRIGSYGVLALILGIGLRVSALAAIGTGPLVWLALICTGATSRAVMGMVMCALRPARADGVSVHVGRPRPATAALGIGLAA